MTWPEGRIERVASLYDNGYHLMPMRVSGDSKAPAPAEWKPYQTAQPSEEDMTEWIDDGFTEWALIAGTPMRLACLDIESAEPELFKAATDRFPDNCKVPSPSGGYHVWLEVTDGALPRNEKLATRFLGEWVVSKNGVEIPRTRLLAEVRGDGGYAVLVGDRRAMPDDWKPFKVTRAEFDAVTAEITALGDDMAAVVQEHNRLRGKASPDADYTAEGSIALARAERDRAFFTVCVQEFSEDLDMHEKKAGRTYHDGREWRARCPVHTLDGEDHSNSSLAWGVTVTGKEPRFVWHCHANCAPDDIAMALGFWLAEGDEDDYDIEVQKRLTRLKVDRDAKILLAEESQPSRVPEFKRLGDIEDIPMKWRVTSTAAGITHLIAENSQVILVADRKVGKSSIALQICKGYLSGGSVLGAWTVAEPLAADETVAYINYEVSESQVAAWMRECGLDAERTLVLNLRGEANPLLTESGRKKLAEDLKRHNVKFLVIDPLGKALPLVPGAENDAGAINGFYASIAWICQQAGVREHVVVAHSGKDGSKARGSSAIEGNPDTIIYLRKDETTDERYLRAEGRDVSVPEAQITWDGPSRTNIYMVGAAPLAPAQKKSQTHRNAIRLATSQFLKKTKGASANQIIKEANWVGAGLTGSPNPATLKKALDEDEGFVQRGSGPQTKWYRIQDDPEAPQGNPLMDELLGTSTPDEAGDEVAPQPPEESTPDQPVDPDPEHEDDEEGPW